MTVEEDACRPVAAEGDYADFWDRDDFEGPCEGPDLVGDQVILGSACLQFLG